MVLVAAYGRCYKTKEHFMADWNKGKDFVALEGPRHAYTSKYDCPKGAHEARYGKKLEKVFILTV